jgi:hypothetical protein
MPYIKRVKFRLLKVKTETGTKCHRDTMRSLLEKGNLVINPNQAADAFNSYFLESVEKLELQDRFCYSIASELQF